jgi:hypothetical protein
MRATAEVLILSHENALRAMKDRAAKLYREHERIIHDLEALDSDIRAKEAAITAARDKWLVGGCV